MLCEELRADVEGGNWAQLGLAFGVTISFGIAEYRSDPSPERIGEPGRLAPVRGQEPRPQPRGRVARTQANPKSGRPARGMMRADSRSRSMHRAAVLSLLYARDRATRSRRRALSAPPLVPVEVRVVSRARVQQRARHGAERLHPAEPRRAITATRSIRSACCRRHGTTGQVLGAEATVTAPRGARLGELHGLRARAARSYSRRDRRRAVPQHRRRVATPTRAASRGCGAKATRRSSTTSACVSGGSSSSR